MVQESTSSLKELVGKNESVTGIDLTRHEEIDKRSLLDLHNLNWAHMNFSDLDFITGSCQG